MPSGWKGLPIHPQFDFNWQAFQRVGSHIYIYTYVYTYVNTYYVMCISISMANTLAEITPARQVNGVSIIKIAVVQ